jgi:thymidine phosphorylase
MVAGLGGPLDFLSDPDRHLEQAPIVAPCLAGRQGFVAGYDTRAVGLSVVALGGGRIRPQDPVDHAVGLTGLLPIGTPVEEDTPIAMIHARTADQLSMAEQELRKAVRLSDTAPQATQAILGRHG